MSNPFLSRSSLSFSISENKPCQRKNIPHATSFVCECSANYCDTIERNTKPRFGQYVVYTSGKDGDRFQRQLFMLENKGTLRVKLLNPKSYCKATHNGLSIQTATIAKFHGSAYRKQRNGAYGSREFCAYIKRISRVSGEFSLVHMRTPRY